jgi:hypothetical protein
MYCLFRFKGLMIGEERRERKKREEANLYTGARFEFGSRCSRYWGGSVGFCLILCEGGLERLVIDRLIE